MKSHSRFDANVPLQSRLGRYRLIGELAQGGMGIVYLAVVMGPGGFHKLFAVKELKRELALEQDAVTPFLREAKLAASLSHPNVVQTFEVGSEQGRHFMAMEYLEGESLAYVLARGRALGRPMPLLLGISILCSLLDGLHYAHTLADFHGVASGVVHRDVSPQNVLVTFDGQTKVLDFGIAKALDSAQLTQGGAPKGKVRYMSPEQALGEVVDARADLFAVGVMLAELLNGGRLWPAGSTNVDVLRDLVAGRIPSIETAAPGAEVSLRRIVSKAMAVKREERYETALEMRVDLDAYLSGFSEKERAARAIGSYVSDLLADERQATRAKIADRLRRYEAEATVSDIPVVKMSASHSSGSLGGDATVTREYVPTSHDAAPPTPPSGGARQVRVLLAVIGLAGILTLGVVALRAPSQAGPAAATWAEPGKIVTTPETVQVSISAQPASARLILDGRSLEHNPQTARLPRSSVPVPLRVEAEGFESQELSVVPDRERSLILALRAEAPPSSDSPAEASASVTVAAQKPAGSRPVKRTAPSTRPRDLEPF